MSQKNGNGGLTGKQKAFIEAYLGDANFNATEAARLAGYKGNANTLGVVGHENLRKPKIAERISQRLRESAMSADEVLARLAEQARGAHRDYMKPDGKLDIEQLVADDKAYLIKSIRPNRYGTIYEFYDAQSALALIGKHHRLFVERHEHTGAAGGPMELNVTDARSELERRLSAIAARKEEAGISRDSE